MNKEVKLFRLARLKSSIANNFLNSLGNKRQEKIKLLQNKIDKEKEKINSSQVFGATKEGESKDSALDELYDPEMDYLEDYFSRARNQCYNAVTGKPYSLFNNMLLMSENGTIDKKQGFFNRKTVSFKDPRWMTAEQASSKGWKIKNGSKGTKLSSVHIQKDPKTDLQKVSIFENIVFNAEQVEGIPPLQQEEPKLLGKDIVSAIKEALSASDQELSADVFNRTDQTIYNGFQQYDATQEAKHDIDDNLNQEFAAEKQDTKKKIDQEINRIFKEEEKDQEIDQGLQHQQERVQRWLENPKIWDGLDKQKLLEKLEKDKRTSDEDKRTADEELKRKIINSSPSPSQRNASQSQRNAMFLEHVIGLAGSSNRLNIVPNAQDYKTKEDFEEAQIKNYLVQRFGAALLANKLNCTYEASNFYADQQDQQVKASYSGNQAKISNLDRDYSNKSEVVSNQKPSFPLYKIENILKKDKSALFDCIKQAEAAVSYICKHPKVAEIVAKAEKERSCDMSSLEVAKQQMASIAREHPKNKDSDNAIIL